MLLLFLRKPFVKFYFYLNEWSDNHWKPLQSKEIKKFCKLHWKRCGTHNIQEANKVMAMAVGVWQPTKRKKLISAAVEKIF